MRDKNLSFIQFSDQIGNFIQRKILIEIPEKAVVINPILLFQIFSIRFLTRKLLDLRGLALISYFLPDEIGWEIRRKIEERIRYFSLKDQLKLSSLLISLPLALTFLYDSNEFSSHEIFGSLVERGLFSLRTLSLQRRKRKVKKRSRRGGYNDHGSLRSPDKWLPLFDFSLTDLQNELERKSDLSNKTHLRMKKVLYELYNRHLKE